MTQPSNNNLASKLGQGFAVLLVAALFFSLGLWQLDRAAALKQSLKNATQIDTSVVSLESITAARQELPVEAINRQVLVSGHYVAEFRAPNQIDGDGKKSDWEVALMQVGTNKAILVVRGLWSERLLNPDVSQAMVIDVQGQLLPHQVQDRALNAEGVISRLDSSVIVGLTDLDLFDGFVLASSESHQGQILDRTRPTPEKITSKIPGYYWQHLSYVVIWWLMAGVVLYLPFYRRRVAS